MHNVLIFRKICNVLYFISGPKETVPPGCFHFLTRLLSASRTRVRSSLGVEDRS